MKTIFDKAPKFSNPLLNPRGIRTRNLHLQDIHMTHKCMTPVHSFHGRYLRAYRLNYTLLPKAALRYGCFLVSSSNVFWIPFLDQLGWDGFYNNWERFHSNCSRFTTHVKVEIKCIQRSKNKSSTSSLSLFFTQKWPFCKTYILYNIFFHDLRPKFLKMLLK